MPKGTVAKISAQAELDIISLYEGGKSADFCGAECHCSCFEETAERAVERIDAVIEELTESAGSTCSSSLLAVNVVHGRITPQAKSKAEV